MTQEKPNSTSSIQTEQSKQYESVISLGKHLVNELELEPSVDTLGRWIAHYIAELMVRAENAEDGAEKEAAKEECFESILKLWEHRSALVDGARPLSNLENVLRAIESLRGECQQWRGVNSKEYEKFAGPWLTFAKTNEEAGPRLSSIAAIMAIADTSFDKERKWVEAHGDMISEEESKIISALDGWLKVGQPWDNKADKRSVSEMEPKERVKLVLKDIKDSISRVSEAYNDLEKSLEKMSVLSPQRPPSDS